MKLRIRPEARQDLRDIGDYIAQDDRQAARRFVRALRERCAFLAENPRVGRERPDLGEGLRSLLGTTSFSTGCLTGWSRSST